MKYWIERWSRLRKKELISYPEDFPINDVYNAVCGQEELKSGFGELHEIFTHCYEDILSDPEGMLLPIYDMNEYSYFSKEARLSRNESYKYAKIFYMLGYSGELAQNGDLRINADKLKEQCKALKITNIGAHLNIIGNYGFTVLGAAGGRIKSGSDIIVSFPDNKNVTAALYALAVKANNTNRFEDFCRMSYKLLKNDWNTAEYGSGVDAVADLFRSERDKITAGLIHEELLKQNYCYNFQNWNEGPQIRYYKKEGDRNRNTNADFWLTSMDTEFIFYFRIKNTEKLLEYLKSCPESVISDFTVSDNGCANRISGKCTSGISYKLGGKEVWRCGCCNPNFHVTPTADNYLYYINAVKMQQAK